MLTFVLAQDLAPLPSAVLDLWPFFGCHGGCFLVVLLLVVMRGLSVGVNVSHYVVSLSAASWGCVPALTFQEIRARLCQLSKSSNNEQDRFEFMDSESL